MKVISRNNTKTSKHLLISSCSCSCHCNRQLLSLVVFVSITHDYRRRARARMTRGYSLLFSFFRSSLLLSSLFSPQVSSVFPLTLVRCVALLQDDRRKREEDAKLQMAIEASRQTAALEVSALPDTISLSLPVYQ